MTIFIIKIIFWNLKNLVLNLLKNFRKKDIFQNYSLLKASIFITNFIIIFLIFFKRDPNLISFLNNNYFERLNFELYFILISSALFKKLWKNEFDFNSDYYIQYLHTIYINIIAVFFVFIAMSLKIILVLLIRNLKISSKSNAYVYTYLENDIIETIYYQVSNHNITVTFLIILIFCITIYFVIDILFEILVKFKVEIIYINCIKLILMLNFFFVDINCPINICIFIIKI